MRKAILSMVVFTLFMVGVGFQDVSSYDCETADGSELEPICIYTIEDLDNVRNDLTSYFILMNDLDFDNPDDYDDSNNLASFTTGVGFDPIGNWSVATFEGHFDGGNHTISNLYIDRTGNEYVGLFGLAGYDDDISIQNVHLVDVYIRGGSSTGGVLGYMWSNGTFSNLSVSGEVFSVSSAAGGVFGVLNTSTAVDIVNNATVTSSNTNTFQGIGGIAGYTYGSSLSNVVNNGDVTIAGYRVGGIVGIMSGAATINYAVNTGNVTSTHHSYGTAGGIAGDMSDATISHVYSTGDVYAKGMVGGLVGQNSSGILNNSYTLGDVTNNNGTNFYGKLSGYISVTVTNSFYFDFTELTTPYAGPTVLGTEATHTDLMQLSWQESVIGASDTDMWDFGPLSSGLLPKLMKSDKSGLLPGQIDYDAGSLVFFAVVDTDIEYGLQGDTVNFTVTFNRDVVGTPTIELQGAEVLAAEALTGAGSDWSFTHTIDDSTEGSVDVKLVATSINGEDVYAALEVVDSGLVVDNTAPVITFTGSAINTEDVATFTPNSTITDNYDDEVSDSVTYEYFDASDTPLLDLAAFQAEIYAGNNAKVTVSVTDQAGNTATESLVLFTSTDNTSPAFDLITTQTIQANDYTDIDWTSYILNPTDNVSGVFTFNEVSDDVVYDTVGDYDVTVELVDEALNITQQTFTVEVVDETEPVITVDGTKLTTYEVGDNAPDWTTYYTVTDNGESLLVTVDLLDLTQVDMSVVGTFDITLTVSDGYNESNETVTITMVDTTAPVIDVSDDTIVLEVFEAFVYPSCSVSDNHDTNLTCTVTESVDVDTLGDYTVTVSATDTEGNDATTVNFTVQVVDVTIPVIDVATTSITLEKGDTFDTPSCVATDNYDDNLLCTFSDTMDHLVVGSYEVTVTVADSSGNEAVPVVINVDVIDTTAPIVDGVEANQVYERGTTLTITFDEGTATLNGVDISSGDQVSEAGEYTLEITDLANNTTTIDFEIEGSNIILTIILIISGLFVVIGGFIFIRSRG